MLSEPMKFLRLTREAREMAVLDGIGGDPAVSQRALARAAGVSATMINAYIDGLLTRGLVEVTGETNRSYRYWLTPAGRARAGELLEGLAREVEELHRRLQEERRARAEKDPAVGSAA
jgi:DNA-binding MarR family transcriptional regulator